MNFRDVFCEDLPPYIIGEISCNHDGNLDVVLKTIDGLGEVGADAVKIQTDTLDGTGSTMDFKTEYFTVSGGTIWDGANLMDLYREANTPLEWHKPIFDYCEKRGIECFSTPYSDSTIEFLRSFDMPAVKVASMEAGDVNFVRNCAKLGVPIIISTGMIDMEGARAAVEACREVGNDQIVLLKCVSEYPAEPSDMNLMAIPKIREEFGVLAGLSDHTLTHTSAITATALGARVIEKHVKLDNTVGGPDASFSLTIQEFGEMITQCKEAYSALGDGSMNPKQPNVTYSRSIFVIEDVAEGDRVSDKNIRVIRPGHGMHPNDWDKVLGKSFKKAVKAGHPLKHGDIF